MPPKSCVRNPQYATPNTPRQSFNQDEAKAAGCNVDASPVKQYLMPRKNWSDQPISGLPGAMHRVIGQVSLPGQPPAYNYELFGVNYGLPYGCFGGGTVASCFRQPGCVGSKHSWRAK